MSMAAVGGPYDNARAESFPRMLMEEAEPLELTPVLAG